MAGAERAARSTIRDRRARSLHRLVRFRFYFGIFLVLINLKYSNLALINEISNIIDITLRPIRKISIE